MKLLRFLNWKIVAFTIGLMLMMAAGLFFVHKVQVGRSGRAIYNDALKAEANGELERSAKYYRAYLRFDPSDVNARVRFADLLERMATDPTGHRQAMLVMEQVLSRDPRREPVRRKALAIAHDLNLHADVVRHLEVLTKDHPNEAALEEMFGESLEALKKLEEAAGHYEKSVGLDPTCVDCYIRFARMARANPGSYRKADELFNEAVAKNGKSARALLARAMDKLGTDPAAAAKDLAKARELDANDLDVILALADARQLQGDHAAVRSLLDEGVRKAPKDPRFYLAQELMEYRDGRKDEALEWLRRGDQAVPDDRELLWHQANLLLDMERAKPAREIVERLRALKTSPHLLEYLDSCLLIQDRKWAEAAAKLSELLDTADPATVPPLVLQQASVNLASSYSHLGQFAKSEAAYRQALKSAPRSMQARNGLASALVEQGRLDEAIALYLGLGEDDPSAWLRALPLMIARVMKSSPAARDWRDVTAALQSLEKSRPGSIEGRIIAAQVLLLRGQSAEAEASLKKTRADFPDRVEPWLALAEIPFRSGRFENVPPLLDEAEKALGDRYEIRIGRADYWSASKDREAAERLVGLERGVERFSEENRLRLLRVLAAAHEKRGDSANSLRLWKTITAARPDSAEDQSALFRVALRSGAVDETAAALASIHRVDGAEGHLMLVCKALQILSTVKAGNDPRIADARALLTKAASIGTPKPELFQTLGQVAELAGDREQAIDEYRKAIKGGDHDPEMIRRTVILLYGSRRFDEAQRLLETLRLDDALPASLLTLKDRLQERSAPTAALIESAQKLIASGSTNPDDYLWLADLLNASRRTAEQEPLLKKALALAPERGEPRFAWTRFLVRTGRNAEAEAAVEAASEPLLKSSQPLVLVACYELIGKPDKALETLKSALTAQPKSPAIARAVADFDLRHGKSSEARAILESLVALKESAPRESGWAKRQLVLQECARSTDVRVMELLSDLDRETSGPTAREEDRMMNLRVRAVALSRQAAHPRWREAIDSLETLAAHGYSSAEDEFLLAVLQDEHDNWKRTEELLHRLITSERNPAPMLAYRAKALLRHGRATRAEADLKQLKALGVNDLAVAELEAGLLNATEKPEEAVATLTAALAGKPAPVRARGAALLEEFKSKASFKAAEAILVELAHEGKSPEYSLSLALFFARHGRRAEALALCERIRSEVESVRFASVVNALAKMPGIAPEELARINGWVDESLKKKPTLANLHALRGTLYEQQDKFDEAEKSYRRCLELDPSNVIALNNLAWLTALKAGQGAEALKLVERAIAISGPAPALLDTRAMAELSLGKYGQSVTDLEQAVATEPKAGRLFHLARAQLLNGNSPASAAPYKQAKSGGLTADVLHPLERASLVELARQFPDI